MAQNHFGKIDNRTGTPVTYNFTPLSSAEPFSTTKPYAVGDYVFYEGVLYRCKTDKAAGAWAPTKFEEANLGEHLTEAEKALLTKAEIDGYYDGMTVGNAEQIVGTVFEEDDTAYNYRTTGGSAEVGDRAYVDAIVGGSLPWNQLLADFASPPWSKGTKVDISDGEVAFTPSETWTGTQINGVSFVAGHKYYVSVEGKLAESGTNVSVGTGKFGVITIGLLASTSYSRIATIATASSTEESAFNLANRIGVADFYLRKPQLIDLTAMFGSTIADYIYSLETAHAGDGVAWFRRYFPKPYYAYHAVGMEHVNAVAAKTVGFNQWDEEWRNGYYYTDTGAYVSSSSRLASTNLIPVLPSTTYYFNQYSKGFAILYCDENGDYHGDWTTTNSGLFTTPSYCRNIKFCTLASSTYGTTYKHDINISIRWDNSRDGDYEPYNLHTYPLADLTLRGIPKKDESGNLYFDGDRYLPDGTVERRYGIVDLGTLDYTNGEALKMFFSTGINSVIRKVSSNDETPNWIISDKFLPISYNALQTSTVGRICISAAGNIGIVDGNEYSSVAAFKTAMSGIYLVYELATPTTEEADPYQYPMVVDNWGTEELIDGKVESGDRDVAIPVGHETKYPPNLKDKLESAANNPDADGAYILTHDGGSNTYTPLASNATIQNIIARLEALEGGGENE